MPDSCQFLTNITKTISRVLCEVYMGNNSILRHSSLQEKDLLGISYLSTLDCELIIVVENASGSIVHHVHILLDADVGEVDRP